MLATGPLLGRKQELGEVDQLLRRGREGGGALLIRGDAGVGKSSILSEAVVRGESTGMHILRTTGAESEANLPFAGLHQLLLPSLAGIDRLASRQRSAIRTAFGMSDDSAPDVFLVGLATLSLLADLATSAPVLVIIDDAQWLDPPSSDVLAFVARRLGADPITLLAAIRDGVPTRLLDGGLPELRLGPLDDESARALLDLHSPHLSDSVRSRLLAESVGNPLALVELPSALATEQLQGEAALPVALPLTQRLERAFAARAARMPVETQRVLLIAASDDAGILSEILAAGDGAGAPRSAEALEPAIEGGLVDVKGNGLTFRHPLVRSAVIQSGTLANRRAAHAALAEMLRGEPDRRGWHLAASVLGTNESVARELDAAGERAMLRGAPSIAVAGLERAAELSEDRVARGGRLLRAATIAFQLGRRDLVSRLLREVDPAHLTSLERARMAWIGESFDDGVARGGDPAAPSLIESADAAQAAGDHDLALNLLTGAALRCWWSDAETAPRDETIALAGRLSADPADPRLLMALALAAPIDQGAVVLERTSGIRADANLDPEANRLLGIAAGVPGDFIASSAFFEAAVAGLRAQGRLGLLAQTLTLQAWVAIHLGDRTVATVAAEEGYRLALETAQPLWAARARLNEAILAGLRGDRDGAEHLAADAERSVLAVGVSAVLADVVYARGLTALGAGRAEEAYENLRRLFDHADPAHHYSKYYLAIGDFAEAAAYRGDRTEAQAALEETELAAAKTPSPRLHVVLRYARPWLAEDDAAEALFQAALDVDLTGWPFDRARLLLAFGAWLRRQRRVAESRPPLRQAAEAFDALGIVSWGDRVRQELRASGETSRRRSVASWDQLSPQELHIAKMAADGMSNREIGQRLYLSHRTVGSHLYRIFPKLGVSTRAQLHRVLNAESLVSA